MAVYTYVSRAQLSRFLEEYDLGTLKSHEGIEKGVSNTNYHVITTKGPYILTLFEPHRVRDEDLPFFFSYADYMTEGGIVCPQAIPDRDGTVIKRLNHRAAVILAFLPGEDIQKSDITPQVCAKLGRFLARTHRAAEGFDQARPNTMSLPQWKDILTGLGQMPEQYKPGTLVFLEQELGFLEQNWPGNLPAGAIHADLFPDNVFWQGPHIHAMIDYYFACTDFYAYDLALTLNAWCFDDTHQFSAARYDAFITAYEEVRSLSAAEKGALRTLCRGAALRIALTRLQEYLHYDPKTTLMVPHDPQEYFMKLEFHQNEDIRYV